MSLADVKPGRQRRGHQDRRCRRAPAAPARHGRAARNHHRHRTRGPRRRSLLGALPGRAAGPASFRGAVPSWCARPARSVDEVGQTRLTMSPPIAPALTRSPPTEIRVALAGNPNCGKTSLFNALTGARQHVANYPGVTVERRTGRCDIEPARRQRHRLARHLQPELVFARRACGAGRADRRLPTWWWSWRIRRSSNATWFCSRRSCRRGPIRSCA